MENVGKRKKRLTTFRIIILGFAAVILLGAAVLMLPISSAQGVFTPFSDALFTSTSAVCVTGLVVQDTATYWSAFGQSVILVLIQIGGLGVVTVAASFALLSGRKISLRQRSTMQEALAAPSVGGIVRLTGFILKVTAAIEILGAAALMPTFCKNFGLRGIWMAFFHSISAFCNAGFDILGSEEAKYVSLTAFSENWSVNIVVMLLIVIGGIGFLTWNDIVTHKHHFKAYRLQSKVILITTGVLLIVPAVYFFFGEFGNMPLGERIWKSLFQSVTPRTAGFNTADLTALSGAGRTVIIVLMLIGGSPGSTAGGMKTTTVGVLFANAFSFFRRKEDTEMFGRRVESRVIKNASTVLLMYVTLFLTGALCISIAEGLPMNICLFETASAVGTVGLTLGITPQLGLFSRIVLIILMFLGRVGGVTLVFAAYSGERKNISKLPAEKMIVG